MTDDEQAAPRRMRRARSGRQEQRLPSADREKVRRRQVPAGGDEEHDEREGDEPEDDDLEDDDLEDDQPEGDEPEDEPEEQERRPRPRREPAPRRRARPAAERDGRDDRDGRADGAIPASVAARVATKNVVEFTGRELENVVAIECRDGDWYVDVEVVESHRIPDTTDILAIYQVRLDRSGDLLSYRRTRRYSRGQLDKESR